MTTTTTITLNAADTETWHDGPAEISDDMERDYRAEALERDGETPLYDADGYLLRVWSGRGAAAYYVAIDEDESGTQIARLPIAAPGPHKPACRNDVVHEAPHNLLCIRP